MIHRTWRQRVLLTLMAFISVSGVSLWAASIALTPSTVGHPKAPMPHLFDGAVVRIYGADVWGVRGRFAIHTWVATKAKGAQEYQIYQVIGWRLRRGEPVVSISNGMPDKPWFGSPPLLLHEVTGTHAEALIEPIHNAALSYPYAREYTMWPGPNSNSFTAWIGLEVPDLGLALPAKAIGKSWMLDEYAGQKAQP